MPITWGYLEQHPVLRVAVTDAPSLEEIKAFLVELSETIGGRPPLPMFYDLTEMEASALDDRFIRAAIVLDRTFRSIKRGRQAYVTADPETERFIERYLELISAYRFAPVARHFRGAQAGLALDWLLDEETDLPDRLV